MANMVMEKLLPLLSKDLLPRLKAKKTEKKKVWFSVSLITTCNQNRWVEQSEPS